MASIEVSLSSSTNTLRRRKGTSLGGCTSRQSFCSDTISLPPNGKQEQQRSALQERDAIIQNLRQQLGLGKLPRPAGALLDKNEIPAAERQLKKLRNDAENRRITIRNLKTALESLDITE